MGWYWLIATVAYVLIMVGLHFLLWPVGGVKP